MKRIISLVLVLALGLAAEVAKADFTFGTPTKVPNVNTSSSGEANPEISADGLSLYFSCNWPGGYGNGDIWVATRETTADEWGAPVNLGPPVNSSAWDNQPSISADGLELHFSDGVPGYTVPYRPGWYGGGDLWVSTRATTDDPWGEPVNLGSTVNSSAGDTDPEISADGLTLFFHSGRPGGSGGEDIYVTTRATTEDPWGTLVNLGPNINTSQYDGDPEISPNGLSLFFCSNRLGGFGTHDLWVTRREVYPATADSNKLTDHKYSGVPQQASLNKSSPTRLPAITRLTAL